VGTTTIGRILAERRAGPSSTSMMRSNGTSGYPSSGTFTTSAARRIEKQLTREERILYMKEIKADISSFKRSYERADLQVTITGLDPEASAAAIDARLGRT
jgi:hypothetical protein